MKPPARLQLQLDERVIGAAGVLQQLGVAAQLHDLALAGELFLKARFWVRECVGGGTLQARSVVARPLVPGRHSTKPHTQNNTRARRAAPRLLHDGDRVRPLDGAEAVGHDDGGAAHGRSVQGGLQDSVQVWGEKGWFGLVWLGWVELGLGLGWLGLGGRRACWETI